MTTQELFCQELHTKRKMLTNSRADVSAPLKGPLVGPHHGQYVKVQPWFIAFNSGLVLPTAALNLEDRSRPFRTTRFNHFPSKRKAPKANLYIKDKDCYTT